MNQDIYIKLLEELLANINEGIHFVDQKNITQIYNHNMEKIEGMDAKVIIGKNFRSIFKDIPEEESTLLKALKGISIKDNIQRYQNKNGKEIIALNTTLPIKVNGKILGALEISKDITKIKKLSDELIKLQTVNNEIGENLSYCKKSKYSFDDIIGECPKIKRTIDLAKRATESDATVFIYGETGTGKELLSRATNKMGLFEQANGGTLLLDEINSIPIELQTKLLRVLQEKTVRRIGGVKDIPVDVRIISTTNENPKDIIKNGKMRLDLYYRLNLIYLELSPLREREEDILLLSQKFLNYYNRRLNKNIKGLGKEVEEVFMQYLWPGNIRELENVIQSNMILTNEDFLTKEFLNINWDENFFKKKEKKEEKEFFIKVAPDPDIDIDIDENDPNLLNNLMVKMEEKYIREAVDSYPYNLSKAAAYLGISRQALQYKMKKYNIK